MLTEERQQQILDLLEQENVVKVHDLTNLLKTSESTIRRDLQDLEDQGLLERVHGGAKKIRPLTFEANMREKEASHQSEKIQIAQLAATQVQESDIIYLDAGTSTLAMIPFLKQLHSLTVVTNSVKHASLLIDAQIETIILGGKIKLTTNATLGFTSIQQLQQFHFNKVFLGTNGLDLKAGFTTPDPEEATLKRLALENSEHAFILADHSKFNQVTFTTIAPLKAATVITDTLSEDARRYLEKTKILEVTK
ncbi:MAG: DeoR/GlpR family DNA-binding transcription regulator [Enterococcus sp.]